MKNIGVLTSGGDSPGMNAAIRAVVRAGDSAGLNVFGILDGYLGLYQNKLIKLERRDVSDLIIRGGTMLGSARLPEFKNEDVLNVAVDNCKKNGLDGLVVIGGDGTYKGAISLAKKGIKTIALPGTIDNDIAATEMTIGFDTALTTIVENVDKLRDTSSSHHRCSVIEVMGNQCGDLAMYAGISTGAEIIITKETGFDEVEVLEKLRYYELKKKKNHAIVIISEKITDVEMLAKKITQHTGFSGRSTVLGHIQRGGSPTPFDRMLATRMGDFAVTRLIEGFGSECVCLVKNEICAIDIEQALSIPRSSIKLLKDLHHRLV